MEEIGMRYQFALFSICALALASLPVTAQNKEIKNKTQSSIHSHTIGNSVSGTLRGIYGPIVGAEITLIEYIDENCVKLAAKKDSTEEELKQLKDCQRKH